MAEAPPTSSAERRTVRHARQARASWACGVLASVLFHALLFLAWRAAPVDEGARAAAARAPALDDPVRVVDVRQPVRREIPVPARPVLAFELPDVAAPEPAPWSPGPHPALRRPSPPAVAALSEIVDGPPPTAEEGDGYVRPIALSILPDWTPPRSLHGVEIVVRVHTSAAGRATGLVELVPPTPDPGMNREIVRRVRDLEYRPAFRNGQPVAAWAEITFVFCRTGVTATSPASPTGLADPCGPRLGGPDR